MKFIHFFLFSILVTVSYSQILRGLLDPLYKLGDTLFPKKVAVLPENERLNKTNCGCRLSVSSRIVGGQNAGIIPMQAVLVHSKNESSVFCGATIVNNYYIITTAHCTDKKNASNIKVRVGIDDLDDEDSSKVYEAEKIFQGDYSTVQVPGDIAIIKLKSAIKFIPKLIEPGCLNLEGTNSFPNGLMASGFGTITPSYRLNNGTYVQGQISKYNKKAFFKQTFSGCRSDLICIDSTNKDSVCNGDSGGPLFYIDEGIATVEGGASFVRGFRKFGIPFLTNSDRIYVCTGWGAYSKFSYYKNWIKSIVGEEYCDAPISK